jgi:hypothetical protein
MVVLVTQNDRLEAWFLCSHYSIEVVEVQFIHLQCTHYYLRRRLHMSSELPLCMRQKGSSCFLLWPESGHITTIFANCFRTQP